MDYLVCKELYHHGIKGQKWGIRKYQNEDGSLTPEGIERYRSDVQSKSFRQQKKDYIRDKENSAGMGVINITNHKIENEKTEILKAKAKKETELTNEFYKLTKEKRDEQLTDQKMSDWIRFDDGYGAALDAVEEDDNKLSKLKKIMDELDDIDNKLTSYSMTPQELIDSVYGEKVIAGIKKDKKTVENVTAILSTIGFVGVFSLAAISYKNKR